MTCDFKVANGNATAGQRRRRLRRQGLPVALTSADGSAGGSVPGHAVADARHAGLVRRVHARASRKTYESLDHGQRDLDRR